ncbi:MAG TPA: potassium channel protein [Acidimicrobiales bacterium]|nr:potassium channel protein [Acidimicrobiales bacterium]
MSVLRPRTRIRRRGRRRGRLLAARVRLPGLLLLLALLYGTVGYQVIEGFSFLNALYMTVTTLTTIGFGEIEPLSSAGRVFTITLVAFGVVVVFDLIAQFTSLLASGRLSRTIERRAMQRQISRLSDHFVICAFGRVGRAATQELVRHGADVVVVEVQEALEDRLIEADVPYLIGDPSEESVLEEAGIRRARALLCAVDSDVVNVYITLSARALNPDLFIIARASRPESVEKLRRAGADRVVSPYAVSGVRMASQALQPAMLEFVDMVTVAPELRIEELVVGKSSALATRTVREVCAPYEGVMVLAVRSPEGELLIPPRADTVLDEGDLIIVVGPADALAGMAEAAT